MSMIFAVVFYSGLGGILIFDDISNEEELQLEFVYLVLSVASDAYWMMISMILVVMATEIKFIGLCLKSRDLTQFQLLTESLMDVVSLMNVFAKCFSVPLAFGLIVLFFDGTLQLFQFFLLVGSEKIDDTEKVDVFYYILWYLPFAIKFSTMLHLATITSNKVSPIRCSCLQ